MTANPHRILIRCRSVILVAWAVFVCAGTPALAQTLESVPALRDAIRSDVGRPVLEVPQTEWLRPLDDGRWTREPAFARNRTATHQTGLDTAVQETPRERSVRRKVLGAIVGATGGFFAGGYAGAAIEGDSCHCDDPGLKGALIGMPIGAVIGGIVGAKWLF